LSRAKNFSDWSEMTKQHESRKWYLTAIATTYFVLCTASCVYYATLFFCVDGATVPLTNQFICLGMAVASATYFFRPRIGRLALLILTGTTILAIGEADPKATEFHSLVLLVLLIPLLKPRRNRPAANPAL
jgi:hypothetical protein